MDTLNIETAWPLMQEAARKMLRTGTRLRSQKQGKEYPILRVEENTIIVDRDTQDGRGTREVPISRTTIQTCLGRLKECGGRVARQGMYKRVAVETAVVAFHPDLRWAENAEFIVYEPQR